MGGEGVRLMGGVVLVGRLKRGGKRERTIERELGICAQSFAGIGWFIDRVSIGAVCVSQGCGRGT